VTNAEPNTPEAWIEVVTILGSYLDPNDTLPVCCEHDQMWICVDPDEVSDEHKRRLAELGWDPDESNEGFQSYQNA
jgi:hypothetical protein